MSCLQSHKKGGSEAETCFPLHETLTVKCHSPEDPTWFLTESSKDDTHGSPFGTLESFRSRHKLLENVLRRSLHGLQFRKEKERNDCSMNTLPWLYPEQYACPPGTAGGSPPLFLSIPPF